MIRTAKEVEMVKWNKIHVVYQGLTLTLLHSESPKLHGVLAILSAIGLLRRLLSKRPLKHLGFAVNQ